MNIEKLVRKNILQLKPYTSARGSHLKGILLDANENAYGSVVEYEGVELNRYPDPNQNSIRNGLSEYLNIPKENLFFGVGSDEIIDLLIRIFCEPGKDNVIIPEPTYGMYKVACDINNVAVNTVPLDENYQPDIPAITNLIDENTKLLFLCSPNNPTGNLIDKEKVLEITNKLGLIVIIDEAYIDFAEEGSVIDYVKDYNNLIVMRTFSKAWGLAGIRSGYCAADKAVVDLLFKVKAPYNVNKLTSQTIENALQNVNKKKNFIEKIISERERVAKLLIANKKIDKVFPSDANFILFRCNDARRVYNKLAEKNLILRDRSNQLNLENCLRVTIGTKEENDMFINLLDNVL